MPANGFIGFITSQGFFIGLIFGTLKSEDPFGILVYTLAVTAVFYMFSQIAVSYFVRNVGIEVAHFANHDHELMLDHYARELQKREEIYESGEIHEEEGTKVEKKKGEKRAS